MSLCDQIYQLPSELEAQKGEKYLILNAWNMQNIVFEIVTNYCINNTPASLGFGFGQSFNSDYTKSGIHIAIAYDLKKPEHNKRPAIFISRGAEEFKHPTLGGIQGREPAESKDDILSVCTLPIMISCIATNLGFTEMLAEYVKQPLLSFRTQIRQDFRLREWKLIRVGPPKNIVEPKDHFVIELELMTAFDEGSIVRGDHLKLKTISRYLFDKLTDKPIVGL